MWERTRVSFRVCYLTQCSISQFCHLPAMFMILFFLYNCVIVLCGIVCITFFLFTLLLMTNHRDWSHLPAISNRLTIACAGVSEEGYRVLWIYSQEWIMWQSYSKAFENPPDGFPKWLSQFLLLVTPVLTSTPGFIDICIPHDGHSG